MVECQLLALQNVSVAATALARSGRHNGEETTGLELLLQCWLNLSGLQAVGMLLLHALAWLLLLGWSVSLCLSPSAQVGAVVCLVPLSEWSSVDLDNGRFGEGVCSDELVVGRMEGDTDDTDFAGDGF